MKGRAGIVTGGASGIGAAVVRRLLQEGAHVHAVDRNGEALDQLAKELSGSPLTVAVGDIADETVPKAIVSNYAAKVGRLDFLVNAAGIVQDSVPLHELSTDSFDRVFAVNTRGAFLFYRAVSAEMIKAGTGGAIVNISSTAGMRPVARAAAYVGSKQALIGLTTSAALEVAAQGIRVNAICPGVTDTPLFRANVADGGPATNLAEIIPIRRFGAPADIANGVFWLLSDQASYVTGVVLPIDGGLTLV